jgi:hypothetical protein
MSYSAPQIEIEELYMGLADYGDRRSPVESNEHLNSGKSKHPPRRHGGTEKNEEEKEFLIAAISSFKFVQYLAPVALGTIDVRKIYGKGTARNLFWTL